MKYAYYNDDRSLMRTRNNYQAEQYDPKKPGWAPSGGYPSLRAARLNYEQATEMAYRLVNSYGDKSQLENLDIGPEEIDETPDEST